ncbi:MAG: hypothetical protein D6748_08985 [Calditrichaeota bacterium]|nr:MAG: hypothetical protein D6748_08985 [Calditrichota bacterium]
MRKLMTLAAIAADTTLTQMSQSMPEKKAGENIYIVLAVTVLIFGGVFFYLLYLDKKVNRLKKKVESREE